MNGERGQDFENPSEKCIRVPRVFSMTCHLEIWFVIFCANSVVTCLCSDVHTFRIPRIDGDVYEYIYIYICVCIYILV